MRRIYDKDTRLTEGFLALTEVDCEFLKFEGEEKWLLFELIHMASQGSK